MPYRSDLEAAHARLDAMGGKRPCPICARRTRRRSRLYAVASAIGYLVVVALACLGAMFVVILVILATAEYPRFG